MSLQREDIIQMIRKKVAKHMSEGMAQYQIAEEMVGTPASWFSRVLNSKEIPIPECMLDFVGVELVTEYRLKESKNGNHK